MFLQGVLGLHNSQSIYVYWNGMAIWDFFNIQVELNFHYCSSIVVMNLICPRKWLSQIKYIHRSKGKEGTRGTSSTWTKFFSGSCLFVFVFYFFLLKILQNSILVLPSEFPPPTQGESWTHSWNISPFGLTCTWSFHTSLWHNRPCSIWRGCGFVRVPVGHECGQCVCDRCWQNRPRCLRPLCKSDKYFTSWANWLVSVCHVKTPAHSLAPLPYLGMHPVNFPLILHDLA